MAAVPFVNYFPRSQAQPLVPANPINDGSVAPSSYSTPVQPAAHDDSAMGAIIRSLGGQGVLPPGFGGGPTPAPVTQGPSQVPGAPPAVVPPVGAGGAVQAPWAQGTSRGGFLNPFTGIVPRQGHVGLGGPVQSRPAHPVGVAPGLAQWFAAHHAQAQTGQHPLVQLLQGLFGQQAPTA